MRYKLPANLLALLAYSFKCSLDAAKRRLSRCLDAVFGKIARTASEEVVLELVKRKCLTIFSCTVQKLAA